MQHARTRVSSALALVMLVTTWGAIPADGRVVVFDGFDDASSLLLNGSAVTTSTSDGVVLRLTPASVNEQGSAFAAAPVDTSAFSTHFIFRMSDPGGGVSSCDAMTGADGLVFVVQRGRSGVSGMGVGIGYGGLPNSVGVEWDTWCNMVNDDPDSNHLGIDVNGEVEHGTGAPFTASVVPAFTDGNLWHGWVDYDGTTLEVRTNQSGERPVVPDLTREVDVPAIVGSSAGFVGFTAGTGGAWAAHDIVHWEYRDNQALLEGKKLLVTQKKSGQQRLIAVAKDTGVGSGTPAAGCDLDGELVIVAEGAGARETRLLLEAARWKPISARHPERGCKYRKGSVVAKVVVKVGKVLKVIAKGSDLGIPLLEDPTPVRIELRHRGIRHCLRFGGTVRHKPERKLLAKRADPPGGCPTKTVPTSTSSSTTTTTSTSTTTTTEPRFYNDCINVAGLCDPAEICVSYPAGFGVCALPCTMTAGCPQGRVETAPASCEVPIGFPSVCVQTCGTTGDCLGGMTCFNGVCYWSAIQ